MIQFVLTFFTALPLCRFTVLPFVCFTFHFFFLLFYFDFLTFFSLYSFLFTLCSLRFTLHSFLHLVLDVDEYVFCSIVPLFLYPLAPCLLPLHLPLLLLLLLLPLHSPILSPTPLPHSFSLTPSLPLLLSHSLLLLLLFFTLSFFFIFFFKNMFFSNIFFASLPFYLLTSFTFSLLNLIFLFHFFTFFFTCFLKNFHFSKFVLKPVLFIIPVHPFSFEKKLKTNQCFYMFFLHFFKLLRLFFFSKTCSTLTSFFVPFFDKKKFGFLFKNYYLYFVFPLFVCKIVEKCCRKTFV